MSDKWAIESVSGPLEAAAKGLLPSALASILDLFQGGSTALALILERRDEQAFQDFLKDAYQGDVFPENARAMTHADLLGMLQAHQRGSEQAKDRLYAGLACAIALGNIAPPLKPVLMEALAQLSFQQVDRLRKAWVARRYELKPDRGSGRKSAGDFLGGKGSLLDQRDYRALEAHMLVDNQGLTSFGSALAEACFSEEDRRPEAIGEQIWVPGHLYIFFYEPSTPRFIFGLSEAAWEAGIRSSILALPGSQQALLMPDVVRRCVVVVHQDTKRLFENTAHIDKLGRRGVAPILVFLGKPLAEAVERFPGAMVFCAQDHLTDLPDVVLGAVITESAKAATTEHRA